MYTRAIIPVLRLAAFNEINIRAQLKKRSAPPDMVRRLVCIHKFIKRRVATHTSCSNLDECEAQKSLFSLQLQ
jgi:hypothetical protein